MANTIWRGEADARDALIGRYPQVRAPSIKSDCKILLESNGVTNSNHAKVLVVIFIAEWNVCFLCFLFQRNVQRVHVVEVLEVSMLVKVFESEEWIYRFGVCRKSVLSGMYGGNGN